MKVNIPYKTLMDKNCRPLPTEDSGFLNGIKADSTNFGKSKAQYYSLEIEENEFRSKKNMNILEINGSPTAEEHHIRFKKLKVDNSKTKKDKLNDFDSEVCADKPFINPFLATGKGAKIDNYRLLKEPVTHKYVLELDNDDIRFLKTPILMNDQNKPLLTIAGSYFTKSGIKNESQNLEFSELERFLNIFFLKQKFNEYDVVLSFNEITLLDALLEKKLGCRLPIKNIYLIEDVLSYNSKSTRRRAEECYKLVFKQAFKYLQKRFESSILPTLKSDTSMNRTLSFYQHYFGSIAKKDNLALENYYLPLTTHSKDLDSSQVVAKTINSTYISIVLRSTTFLIDLQNYIESNFLQDYVYIASNKIRKIIKNWEVMYYRAFSQEKAIDSIYQFIVHNKKTKLPWFYAEVEGAVEVVKQLVDKHKRALF